MANKLNLEEISIKEGRILRQKRAALVTWMLWHPLLRLVALGWYRLRVSMVQRAHRWTSAIPSSRIINVSTAAPVQKEAGISWHRNFDAAKKVAQKTGKPIFIDFYASWCANCTEFKKESASNPQLNQALRDKAIAVKLVDKEPEVEKIPRQPRASATENWPALFRHYHTRR